MTDFSEMPSRKFHWLFGSSCSSITKAMPCCSSENDETSGMTTASAQVCGGHVATAAHTTSTTRMRALAGAFGCRAAQRSIPLCCAGIMICVYESSYIIHLRNYATSWKDFRAAPRFRVTLVTWRKRGCRRLLPSHTSFRHVHSDAESSYAGLGHATSFYCHEVVMNRHWCHLHRIS